MSILGLASSDTSTTQTVNNQQATAGTGAFSPAIGAHAGRGTGNVLGISGITLGGNLGAQLRNVGNFNTRLQNQIAGLTRTLTAQQNNLNRAKPGSARYNTIAANIAKTQGKLNAAQTQLKNSQNQTINAGTTVNITSTDTNALALAQSALDAVSQAAHDTLNANQALATNAGLSSIANANTIGSGLAGLAQSLGLTTPSAVGSPQPLTDQTGQIPQVPGTGGTTTTAPSNTTIILIGAAIIAAILIFNK